MRYARACLWAPAIAFVLSGLTMTIQRTDPEVHLIIRLVTLVLLLIGLVAGLAAIGSWLKCRQEGVLGKAIAGLSMILFVVAVSVYTTIQDKKFVGVIAETNRKIALEQAMRDALAMSGWAGGVRGLEHVIAIAGPPDECSLVRLTRERLGSDFSMLVIYAENQGLWTLEIDPEKAKVHLVGGKEVEALDWRQVIRGAPATPEPPDQEYSWPRTVSPRSKMKERVVFLPPGVEMKDVRSVSLRVNKLPVEVIGKWTSAEEKQAIAGQQMIQKR